MDGGGIIATFTVAGMSVSVAVMDRTADDEPMGLLVLNPVGPAALDGEEPGVYYIVPDEAQTSRGALVDEG